MKSGYLPFITVQPEIKTKETKEQRRWEQRVCQMGRKRTRAHVKNKTFPLMTSVTSWLYFSMILDIFEDAEYISTRALNPLTYKLTQPKPASFSTKTS